MIILWLNQFSHWQLAFLLVFVFVAISVGLTWLSNRIISPRFSGIHSQVALYTGASGTVYGLLLALIAGNAWGNLASVNAVVSQEAYSVGNLYRNLEGYPASLRKDIRQQLRDYVDIVVKEEWPALQQGRKAIAARPVLDRIFQSVTTFKPSTMGEMAVQSAVLSTLNAIALTHRQREGSAGQRVMPVMWVVVCVAAFVVMALMSLTTTGYAKMDYLLAGGYGAIIGLVIFLIISLDHPFVGESNVSPGAFLEVLGLMDHLDAIAPSAASPSKLSH